MTMPATLDSQGATQPGVILGTAAYMSPEQARGKTVDKRTDIWAFGCLLYEMLAGERTFHDETVSDTIARILEREPDWGKLHHVPRAVLHLLRRCLAKDLRSRLHDIADARIEPEIIAAKPAEATGPSEPSVWKNRRLILGLAAAGLLVAVAVGLAMRDFYRPESPPGWTATVLRAVSPDDHLVLSVGSGDKWYWQAAVLDLKTGKAQRIPLNYTGDITLLSWQSDGRISAAGWPVRSSIWALLSKAGRLETCVEFSKEKLCERSSAPVLPCLLYQQPPPAPNRGSPQPTISDAPRSGGPQTSAVRRI